MSTTTTKFGLIKPELTDTADITALNTNWDKIDEALGNSNEPVTATSNDGLTYTATISNLTELYNGLVITIIPNVVSASTTPTLNVNGLGAKNIRQPLSTNTTAVVSSSSTTWLTANKPVQLQYDGTQWRTINLVRPSASTIYGQVPIENGGTGASTPEQARTNLGVPSTNHTHNYAGSSTAGGVANSATKLATSRTIRTNLGSTSTASFDGTGNVTPGVTGTLPIANGGTGATTAADVRTNLEVASIAELPNLYIWKVYTSEPGGGYTLENATTLDLGSSNGQNSTTTYEYANAISTDDQGNIVFVKDGSVSIAYNNMSGVETLRGKYIKYFSGNYYYCQESVEATQYTKDNNGETWYGVKLNNVQKVKAKTSTFKQYVASKSKSTYPTNGSSGGYWYKYHKQLGE